MKKVNTKRAVDLVMRLMAVPGKSCEEALIAEEVLSVLHDAGVPDSAIAFDSAHRRTPRPGQVGNLIVKLPGNRRRPRLMLSAHLDTVPICVGAQPKRSGNTVRSLNPETGLGADDRAGVASVLTAALESLEESPADRPPLTLCFLVQEEIGLQGSHHLSVSKLGKPAMALNFDGGNPRKLTVGATGGERIKIEMHGCPAHAGLAPETGASAVQAAGLAIASLHKNKWLGAVRKGGKLGTSNIGVVCGGVSTNVVAGYAEIEAEARSHDSEFRTKIAEAIEEAFVKAADQVQNADGQAVRAKVMRRVDYESYRLEEDAEIVQLAERAVKQLGVEPVQAVTNGGIDASWLVKHGIPTVTIGCGQRQVHTTDEELDIPDYLEACHIGKWMIHHCGR